MQTCGECFFFVECCGNVDNKWGYCEAPLSMYHADIVAESPRTLSLNSKTCADKCKMFTPLDYCLDNV